MPDTKLILHVKGTEAQTTEVPKDEVRTGLSQGKITYSQLIWSASDHAWKQAREYPELMPTEPLILHVKGTEAETRQVPKPQVRSGIARGEISHSQLIWSAPENAWKQVREMPDLLPSQKLAPAPPLTTAPATMVPDTPHNPVAHAAEAVAAQPQAKAPSALTGSPTPKPKVATASATATPKVAVAGTPKVAAASAAPKVAAAGTPKVAAAGAPKVAASAGGVKVAAAGVPKMAAAGSPSVRQKAMAGQSSGSIHVKEEEDHFHPMKWLCIGVGSIAAVLVIANFFLLSLPLSSNFGRTAYPKVTVFAHFGAFVQPDVMVIHIRPSTAITEDNLDDILVALSRSSPTDPLTRGPFDRVAITSGWMAQYSFSGSSWKELGQLDQESPASRRDVLLAQMDDAGGDPLLPQSTLDEQAQKKKRDEVWKEFASHFIGH